MGFCELSIKHSYTGKGKKILQEFLLPVLSETFSYDRITGYYTLESLLAISQGVESIFERSGKMRLIIGIHSIPRELVDAALKRKYMEDQIDQIREELSQKIMSLRDALVKKRLATLAWMIEDGLLEIKAAAVEGEGIFHPKTLIFTDADGNKIAAVGSSNETGNGLGSNFEQLMVAKSWVVPDAVENQEYFFDTLWENNAEGALVSDISEDTADMIITALGEGYDNPHHVVNGFQPSEKIIAEAAVMPANFFVSGDIPALYMHQERAVIDALSRWPVRVLFADEVGLGKTFETSATMVFLTKYCGVKRVVVLTPKSVLQQWQDELYEHFGLEMWRYDSNTKQYVSPNNKIISMNGKNPLGKNSPDMILMSAQFARGSGKGTDLFNRKDTVLPELLVVDEAHSARVSQSLTGGKKKTRMYQMLEAVSRNIPHLILATATPMQKDAEEYHSILQLLGLPNAWKKERTYRLSLKLIGNSKEPDISDASSAGAMLYSTMNSMKPSLIKLESEERKVVEGLVHNYKDFDQYDVGCYVLQNWPIFRRAFIKMHPARLLTVRNTRRSLSEVGYKFPKRNLIEKAVLNADRIELFYDRVNSYLTDDCFLVEKALDPGKKLNVGFIRVSYQQRVASSLHSCRESLKRRYESAKKLQNFLASSGIIEKTKLDYFDIDELIDDIEGDELLSIGSEDYFDILENEDIDIDELKRAVALECMSLSSLISQADNLLVAPGDVKISESISLAKKCINSGDTVLLFSRYTDTIDALINEFKRIGADREYRYGIYTGKKSCIVTGDKEIDCDKNTIKKELFAKNIRLVFCSDAASEGLNLQAARVLINVDVPWTPARLEQRIGRIARLGQVADEVDVYNIWYPNSIEARMYHRIQKRLEETNLAIGEFPEVVANQIKQAVLDDTLDDDDDSLVQLRNIRNSLQTKALEELWITNEDKTTTSRLIRMQLLALCDQSFECVNANRGNRIKDYILPDGEVVSLTAEEGLSESISLQAKPWKYVDFKIPNLYLVSDNEENYAAFIEGQSGYRTVKHEFALQLVSDNYLAQTCFSEKLPKMLSDNSTIDLLYAVDVDAGNRPSFWPPKKEESSES